MPENIYKTEEKITGAIKKAFKVYKYSYQQRNVINKRKLGIYKIISLIIPTLAWTWVQNSCEMIKSQKILTWQFSGKFCRHVIKLYKIRNNIRKDLETIIIVQKIGRQQLREIEKLVNMKRFPWRMVVLFIIILDNIIPNTYCDWNCWLLSLYYFCTLCLSKASNTSWYTKSMRSSWSNLGNKTFLIISFTIYTKK